MQRASPEGEGVVVAAEPGAAPPACQLQVQQAQHGCQAGEAGGACCASVLRRRQLLALRPAGGQSSHQLRSGAQKAGPRAWQQCWLSPYCRGSQTVLSCPASLLADARSAERQSQPGAQPPPSPAAQQSRAGRPAAQGQLRPPTHLCPLNPSCAPVHLLQACWACAGSPAAAAAAPRAALPLCSAPAPAQRPQQRRHGGRHQEAPPLQWATCCRHAPAA